MGDSRRVVVTGMGMVTPIGIGVEGFAEGLHAAKSAVRRVRRFDPSPYRSQMAAEVSDFVPEDYLTGKQLRRLERFAQLSVAAAQLGVTDSALSLEKEDRDRVGVSMGSALGGMGLAEEQHGLFMRDGLRSVSLTLPLSVYGGAANCGIAIDLGATGTNLSCSNSCASGTMAIGEAVHAIRHGRADVMIAGGAEAPIYPLCFGAFDIIKSMSTRNDEPHRSCRPFDAQRDGFVMGEGSAVLVLELLDHAVLRGARIYAEIAGYACTNDAFHMTAPLPDGRQAARSMRMAIDDAGLSALDVDHINAHGSSTPLNDRCETLAIKKVFGDRAYRIPISATKAMHAHSLGASGAIEACASVLAIHSEYIPPTVNLDSPDSECDLDYVPNAGRAQSVGCSLSNSFGFGGINASLVFRRIDG